MGPKDKFRVPVAILTSNVTASSGEATLLSFRGLENTRTFGQPSAGYASGNLIIDMPDGAGLMVTTANRRRILRRPDRAGCVDRPAGTGSNRVVAFTVRPMTGIAVRQ